MSNITKIILFSIIQFIINISLTIAPISFFIKILLWIFLIVFTSLFLYKKLKKDEILLNQLSKLDNKIDILLNKNDSIYLTVDENYKIIEKKISKKIDKNIIDNIIHNNVIINEEINNYLKSSFQKEKSIQTILSIDGSEIKYLSLNCEYIEEKEKKYIVIILTDISEQKRTMKFLRDSESKFSYFADIIPNSIVEYDLHGNIIFMNKSCRRVFGYDMNNLKNILNVFHEEDRIKAKENLQKLLEKFKENPNFSTIGKEYFVIDAYNKDIYVKIISNIRVNEFGVKSVVSIISDVSFYKIQQEHLEKRLEYENLFTKMSRNFLFKTDEKSILSSLKEVSNYLKLDDIIIYIHDNEMNKTIIENKISDSDLSDDMSKLYKTIYSIGNENSFSFIDKYSSIDKEIKNYLFDKSKITYLLTYKFDSDEYNLIIAFCCKNRTEMFIDTEISAMEVYSELFSSITFKKLYNEKLLEKQETLNTLINDSILNVISIVNDKIIYVNDKACEFLNQKKDFLLNKNILNVNDEIKKLYSKFIINKKNIKCNCDLEVNGKIKNVDIEIKLVSHNLNRSCLITFIEKEKKQ